ncbi:MAG TPA: GNAT family N-acetyltransferase [Gaiellaceae bacterium]
MKIAFPPLREEDVGLVERWLNEEHVARWWREPVEEAIEKRYAGIEGRRPTRQFLIVVDRRPAGMIQTYRVSDHPEWQQLVQVGGDVAGVDLLLGEPDLVGRGLGPQVLTEFVRAVVFADPAVNAVVATVEEPNRRSWRAFEKAGFRHVRDVEEDGLPHRLMRLDRPA